MLAASVTFGLFTGLAVGPDAELEDVALRVSLDLILRDIKSASLLRKGGLFADQLFVLYVRVMCQSEV